MESELLVLSPAKPTFTNVKKILAKCGGPIACHRHGPFGGGLDLTDLQAYQNLVDGKSGMSPPKVLVVPEDTQNSFLVQKLTNALTPDEGSPMPKGEFGKWTALTSTQLSVIKRWILAGAPND